jgi:glycosyltransferase involved in cell wall biosynthesis
MVKNSILFLTNAYPDFNSSYRGHFIKNMATRLEKVGYQITIVTPKIFRGSLYFDNQDGIKVYRFPFFANNKLLIEYEKIPYLRMVLYYFSGLITTLYALVKYKCDLIHIHWAIPTGLISVLAGAILKRPFIVTIHGSDFRIAMSKRFLLKIFLYICNKSQHIICVSEVQKKEIEQRGIKEDKISVLPMGINEEFLEKGKKRQEKASNAAFTILSNRTLLPIYNVSLLIRAIPFVLKEKPNTIFLIAGEGSERDRLEIEVKKLNINPSIHFIGRVPHEEMANVLAQSDIYVSTSLYDGTSVSLLEAMACGAFPVVTNNPSNQEWIADGRNGFLISSDDERALARKLIESIRNLKLREEAFQQNQKIVEERAYLRKQIEYLVKIYEKLICLA